jgi:hypothetical protein
MWAVTQARRERCGTVPAVGSEPLEERDLDRQLLGGSGGK